MILDLTRFIALGRPIWSELERRLDALDRDPFQRLSLEELRRFHEVYQRTSADLGRLQTFAAEPELRHYLESLVGRAYGEIHETRTRPHRLAPKRFLMQSFPRAFRRHIGAFAVSLLATLAGVALGAGLAAVDPEVKAALVPFSHLSGDPAERVAREQAQSPDREDPLGGGKLAFSTFLMTHNTRVSIVALALGASYGIGTLLVLFSNGLMLGIICLDYVRAGQSLFLAGWLLPHGAVEIPSILIAGQAGLVLAAALLGRGSRQGVKARLRAVGPDLVVLIGGVAVLLVWAGIVEAFLSQYHEPVIPYALKIAFGALELVLLGLYLGRAGRSPDPEDA